VHTFTLQDSRNWFALGVFVVTSVVVSELAARSRRRAIESTLLAEIASSLLEHGDVTRELDRIAAEAAHALQVERVEIAFAPDAGPGHPLLADGRRVGSIRLVNPRRSGAAARRRLLPALASLLGVAIDRQRLAAEALEAETLRRSDAVKTAVLRAVSHDLRSPLMAMLTSASALAQDELQLDRDDRRELVGTILTETRRLGRLIDNLLDLSRLEAVEHAALRAGLPVDARVETGRTPTHALQRLWEAERFERIVVPAPIGRNHGFTPKELQWILVHAPSETVILRPDPTLSEGLRLARSLDAA
jgi:two-component system sensor histidine kinase KdpD